MSDACFTQKQGWCLAGPEPLSHETKHLIATLLAKRRRCRGKRTRIGSLLGASEEKAVLSGRVKSCKNSA